VTKAVDSVRDHGRMLQTFVRRNFPPAFVYRCEK
jgi:phospholipid N-methyltransferase